MEPADLTGDKLEAYEKHRLACDKLLVLVGELGRETRPDKVWLIMDQMREMENLNIMMCCSLHDDGERGGGIYDHERDTREPDADG